MPLLNWTSSGESILQEMAPSNATAYLPDGTDSAVAAGYMSQVESIIKMHRARSTAGQELMYLNGGTAFISILMHPLSRGTVLLASTDPFENPLVDTRYLTHPADSKLLVDAIRYNRKIIATEAIQQTGATEASPGSSVISEEDLLDYVKKSVSTVWHPSGTCAMLPREQGGVVDPNLIVYGVSNLRIVDASVMPILPGAHMQATVYAIAEKVRLLFRNLLHHPGNIHLVGCRFDQHRRLEWLGRVLYFININGMWREGLMGHQGLRSFLSQFQS